MVVVDGKRTVTKWCNVTHRKVAWIYDDKTAVGVVVVVHRKRLEGVVVVVADEDDENRDNRIKQKCRPQRNRESNYSQSDCEQFTHFASRN
jgi:hypothetical protein